MCSSFLYAGECQHGDVRLVGGETEYEGRVEFCVYRVWGTVCGDFRWDGAGAEVVCNQLEPNYTRERVSLQCPLFIWAF